MAKRQDVKVVEPIRNKDDLKRIINWFYENNYPKYAAIFMLGINSGLRISDILGLDVGDVFFKDEVAIREQKTSKYKRFPLKDEVQDVLNEFCKNRPTEEPLFLGRCGSRLDRSQVYRMINRACEELGIAANVGTHTMRKTFGYHHYRQFKNITLLQTIFNHSSPDVTKRYIGITQDEVNESYQRLNLFASIEDVQKDKVKLSGRKRATKVISYCNNYLKNGGVRHAEFAMDILDIVGATYYSAAINV